MFCHKNGLWLRLLLWILIVGEIHGKTFDHANWGVDLECQASEQKVVLNRDEEQTLRTNRKNVKENEFCCENVFIDGAASIIV